MFFILSKILDFLFTPGFWVLVILLLAWLKPKSRKRFLLLGILVFYFFSNGFLLNAALRMWEWKEETLSDKAKIAVVLGGYSTYNKELQRVEFESSADRILVPLQWYHHGEIDKLLLSGGSGELLKQTYSEQNKVANFLKQTGVKAKDILVEPKSRNTRENAVFTARLVDSLGINPNDLVLVTSSVHMRRSLGCFEKAGLSIQPYPVDFNSEPIIQKASFRYLFIPDMEALIGWNYLFHEWFGYVTYLLMGYL